MFNLKGERGDVVVFKCKRVSLLTTAAPNYGLENPQVDSGIVIRMVLELSYFIWYKFLRIEIRTGGEPRDL